ncbi:MAG TPA: YcxB family protein [Bacillota bacterium]|nr:YcxB family protein [Bacillota bacterium]HPJ24128.1 YcxB family protein [Bacillota bacterium]
MESFKFDHYQTENDFKKSMTYQVFDKRKFNRIFLLYVSPAIGAFFIIFMILMGETSFWVFFLAFFLIFFGPYMLLFVRTMAKKQYQKNDLIHLNSQISFSDEGIEAKSERGQSKYFYSDIGVVRENKEYLFIYMGTAFVIPLSKTQIGDETTNKIKIALYEKRPEICRFIKE